MPNITNYSPLIQSMFGRKGASWRAGATLPGVFQFSQLNSSSIQSQLKAAGIDTSSKRYKAVIEQMKKTGCTGNMFTNVQASHEPPALLVVCCWPYGADVTFPPKGGLTNHCLVTLPPKGGSINHYLVTGGRLKAALCYLAYSPSIWSRSYCSLMYFLIVSSFTLPTVSQ